MKWQISQKDLDDYREERLNRPSAKQIRQYYKGLAYGEKPMFEDEIKDLEKIYRDRLEEINEVDAYSMEVFVQKMETFVKRYREKEQIQEKLENLLAQKECKHE